MNGVSFSAYSIPSYLTCISRETPRAYPPTPRAPSNPHERPRAPKSVVPGLDLAEEVVARGVLGQQRSERVVVLRQVRLERRRVAQAVEFHGAQSSTGSLSQNWSANGRRRGARRRARRAPRAHDAPLLAGIPLYLEAVLAPCREAYPHSSTYLPHSYPTPVLNEIQ